ncbi:microtubule-associated protein 9-like [Argonauta hians]
MDVIQEITDQPKKDLFQLELEAKIEERRSRGYGAGFSIEDSNNISYNNLSDNMSQSTTKHHKTVGSKQLNLNDTLRFDNTMSLFTKNSDVINRTSDTDFLSLNSQRNPYSRSNVSGGRKSRRHVSILEDDSVEESDSLQPRKEIQSSSSKLLDTVLQGNSLLRKSNQKVSSGDYSDSSKSSPEMDRPQHRGDVPETNGYNGENEPRTSPVPTPRTHFADVTSPSNKCHNVIPEKSNSIILEEDEFAKTLTLDMDNDESKPNLLTEFDENNDMDTLPKESDVSQMTDSVSLSHGKTFVVDQGNKVFEEKPYDDYEVDNDIFSHLFKNKFNQKRTQIKDESLESKNVINSFCDEVRFKSNEPKNWDQTDKTPSNTSNVLTDCGSDKPVVKPRKLKQVSISSDLQQDDSTLYKGILNTETDKDEGLHEFLQDQCSVASLEARPIHEQKDAKVFRQFPPETLAISQIRQEAFKKWCREKDKKIKEIQKQKEEEEKRKLQEQKQRLNDAKECFIAWKKKKDPIVRLKFKKEEEEKKKKEEEKKKKEVSLKTSGPHSGKTPFQLWKESKDEVLHEQRKSKKKNQLLETQEKNEKKIAKVIDNKKAFEAWKSIKENQLSETRLKQKQQMKIIMKEKESRKLEKETLSYQSYNVWLKCKEEKEKEHQGVNSFEPKIAWRPPSRNISQI